MKPCAKVVFLSVVMLLVAGCATYISHGPKANLQDFSPVSTLDAKPTAQLPASIAAVRIQAPNYTSNYLRQNGGIYSAGNYPVITTREVEEQDQINRIAGLSQIDGVVSINRLLLPLAAA
ncbi:MAG: hypothetical protein LBV36_01835 [Chromatiales bacterium]|jgi:hypothetical protein|nr:hypothetical protein [Chromatiales bacterium]